jgi:hypothetical protein
VVKVQIGPAVVPLLFFATICQEYVVPPASPGDQYHQSLVFDTIVGGGFVVPSRISYDVAPADCQLSVGDTVTQVAPSGGLGELGGAGPGGGPAVGSVLKDQTGPGVEPLLFFAMICQ